MTFKEKRMAQFTDITEDELTTNYCPSEFNYEDYKDAPCFGKDNQGYERCKKCWNREIPGTEVEQMELEGFKSEDIVPLGESIAQGFQDALDKVDEAIIDKFNTVPYANIISAETVKKILDSGERRQFETGAVRDIQEGKGRCDLMPLDIVGSILEDGVLMEIEDYKLTGSITYLCDAIKAFNLYRYMNIYTMFLEVAKHFEEGAKKYGENNWQKGIPTKHYIDSAVRHYLKFLRGDQDEPHDRAVVWNLLCCIWTVINKPELDSYRKEE